MKLVDLLEIINGDVWMFAFDFDGNLLADGLCTDIKFKDYEDFTIHGLWVDNDNNICFHLGE